MHYDVTRKVVSTSYPVAPSRGFVRACNATKPCHDGSVARLCFAATFRAQGVWRVAEARRHGRFKVPAAARSAQTQAPQAPAGGARSTRCALAPPLRACCRWWRVPTFNTHCESSPLRRRCCFTLRALVTTRSAAFTRRPPFTSSKRSRRPVTATLKVQTDGSGCRPLFNDLLSAP